MHGPCTGHESNGAYLAGVGRGVQHVQVHRGLLTKLDAGAPRRHPGQHEGPGFAWAFDFVYLLLGGGGKI